MGSISEEPPRPWIETPCIFSAALSRAAGCNIYLKLENLQPSGSFKSRGVGNMMFRAIKAAHHQPRPPTTSSPPPATTAFTPFPTATPDVHFFCSSGGNAGLACAVSAVALGRPATIVVPFSTPAFVVEKLRALGALVDVVQVGANWGEADAHLRGELMPQCGRSAVYVPPFDHPDIWDGAASLVDELAAQLGSGGGGGKRVDAIVCSVGGGGLLCGIMEGLRRNELGGAGGGTKVLAVETVGADSLGRSVAAGRLVTLERIASIAGSLGASRVAERAFEWAQSDAVVTATVSDADAVEACVRFLDDHRVLVEVACGATIAPAYNGGLRRHLGKGLSDEQWKRRNVVLVVCGGSVINLDLLLKYKDTYRI